MTSTNKKEQPHLHLEQFLPYRMNVLAKRISHSLSHIYKEFGINIPQWRVLVWLRNHPNLYAKDICAYTYMDKTQVSRLLTQLEKNQLIARKTDQNDCRSQQLLLTEKGQHLLDTIIPKALEWEERLIASFDTSEYHALFQLIEKLENQLNDVK